jgi:RimJ/RimL family protein N-acetyltransferase
MARPRPGDWICARRGHVMPAGPVMLRTALPEDLPDLRPTLDAGTLAALGWTDGWDRAWGAADPAGPVRSRRGRLRFRARGPEITGSAARNPVSERFLVLDGRGRQVIGGIDMVRSAEPRTVGVTFWLAGSARGRSRSVHALEALGRLAAGHLGVRRIVAGSDRANPAAQAVLRRAGFTPETSSLASTTAGAWRMSQHLGVPAPGWATNVLLRQQGLAGALTARTTDRARSLEAPAELCPRIEALRGALGPWLDPPAG